MRSVRSNVTAAAIEARTLGRSDVIVPRVALGCGNFGGVGSSPEFFGRGLDEAQAFAIMDAAWELGINHFDTADAYGGGRSETIIGNWIRSRGQLPLLSTKTFNPMTEGGDHGLAPERMTRQLHSSLERLGVPRVELYLAHDFDPDVEQQRVVETLERLRSEGLIRATGVSNYDAGQLRAPLARGHVDAIQNSYSLLARGDAVTATVTPEGLVVTGKYRRGYEFPAGSRMTQRPDVYADFMRDQVFDSLEQLDELAAARGISMAGLSLSWLLANPDVSAIVVGPGRPDQLEPVREALANPLDPEARESVAGLFR